MPGRVSVYPAMRDMPHGATIVCILASTHNVRSVCCSIDVSGDMNSRLEQSTALTVASPRRRWWWGRSLFIACLVAGCVLASGLSVELMLWRAQVCLDQRQHPRAMAWLNWASPLRPKSAELNFLLARTHRRLERFPDAAAALEQAAALGWSRAEIERERWLLLAQTGRFAEVQAHWNGLFLDARSDGPEICRAFVLMSLQRFQIEPALRVIAGWKADFPRDAEPHFQEGRIAGVGLRWQDAERAYREALRRDPSRNDVREGLADALMKQLKLEAAIVELQQLLERQPTNRAALVHLADCLLRTSRLDEARDTLKSVLAAEPSHYEALVLLGQLELATGRATEALVPLKTAVSLHPEDAEVRYAYAKALRAAGREVDAAEHFRFREQAKEPLLRLSEAVSELVAAPGNLALRFEVGELTWRWKSRDEGEKWLLSVLELAPAHQPANALLARHFELLGHSERAAHHRTLAEAK